MGTRFGVGGGCLRRRGGRGNWCRGCWSSADRLECRREFAFGPGAYRAESALAPPSFSCVFLSKAPSQQGKFRSSFRVTALTSIAVSPALWRWRPTILTPALSPRFLVSARTLLLRGSPRHSTSSWRRSRWTRCARRTKGMSCVPLSRSARRREES